MTDNVAMDVLEVICRNPRISPVLIHDKLNKAMNFNTLEYTLRTLRETGLIETLARGIYVITEKGSNTLRSSEKTEAET